MSVLYYFGCWDRPGHYLHTPDGSTRRVTIGPFGNGDMLDGNFAPKPRPYLNGERQRYPIEDETIACLTIVQGWTVLAMWDRSVDSRGACNAAFVREGEWSTAEMWAEARRWYPQIVARLKAAPPAVASRSGVADSPARQET